MATNASLLALLDTAIEALITGGHSSYSIGSRTVTKHDLPSLLEQRRILAADAARDARGSIFTLAKMGKKR